MKKTFLPLFLLVVCLSLVAFQCEDVETPPTQETEQTELNSLKSAIETLANTSVCGGSFECKYIALGSKPCGGPWGHLVYSSSIDEAKLEELVMDYNKKQAAFNTKWGYFSDCSVANPPSSINCENNVCIPVY